MHLLLIIGPTGIGKTAKSIQYAKELNIPVIVLDRIQIYIDLAITSGRPTMEELGGTDRYYLCDQSLSWAARHGEPTMEQYKIQLSYILSDIEEESTARIKENKLNYTCIIEGGCVTLLQQLGEWLKEFGHSFDVIYLSTTVSILESYKEKVRDRVRSMFFGLASELSNAYHNSITRDFILHLGDLIHNHEGEARPSILRQEEPNLSVKDLDRLEQYPDYFPERRDYRLAGCDEVLRAIQDGSIDQPERGDIVDYLVNFLAMEFLRYAQYQIKEMDKWMSLKLYRENLSTYYSKFVLEDGKIFGGAGVITVLVMDDSKKVLLFHDVARDGYSETGGTLEQEETLKDCAVRESLEESCGALFIDPESLHEYIDKQRTVNNRWYRCYLNYIPIKQTDVESYLNNITKIYRDNRKTCIDKHYLETDDVALFDLSKNLLDDKRIYGRTKVILSKLLQ